MKLPVQFHNKRTPQNWTKLSSSVRKNSGLYSKVWKGNSFIYFAIPFSRKISSEIQLHTTLSVFFQDCSTDVFYLLMYLLYCLYTSFSSLPPRPSNLQLILHSLTRFPFLPFSFHSASQNLITTSPDCPSNLPSTAQH